MIQEAIDRAIEDLKEVHIITYPAEARFLESMVSLTMSKSVLELGTFRGFSTLHLLRAVMPEGHVTSVDIQDVRHPLLRSEDVLPWFTFVKGQTHETMRAMCGNTFDFVYVDSDHRPHQTRLELEALKTVTRPGTTIVFHDVPKRLNPDTTEESPARLLLREYVRHGFIEGVFIQTPDREDVMVSMGGKYHRDCLPHFGIFTVR